jgi:hypothetical protein
MSRLGTIPRALLAFITTMSNVTADPTTEPDVEPPSAEDKTALRRTFVILTFVGACICLPPRQWVSAGILFVVSGGLYWRHKRILDRERPAKAGKPAPPTARVPEEPPPVAKTDDAP